MKLNLAGDLAAVKEGIPAVLSHLGIELCKDGIKVQVKQVNGDLLAEGKGGIYTICYERPIHFFRTLGLLAEQLAAGNTEFSICETPQFDHCGVMPDLARSAVFIVSEFKRLLVYMALMGLDEVMLYLEQSFCLPDEPYFGYMLSQYTAEDLKELDDFANTLGISMYPAIQALSHMEVFLRWPATQKYKDKGGVLLINDEETDALIVKMLRTASAPFRSNKINIGFDETFDLGKGAYERKHGVHDLFDLYYMHLRHVTELAQAEGLQPIAWGDMFLMHASSTKFTWNSDLPIPKQAKDSYPKGLNLIHWDYYSHEEKWYEYYLSKILELDPNAGFGGGIWNWTSLTVNQSKTIMTANPALKVCKKLGIRKVTATIWGCNYGFYGTLLGLQLFAEHTYHAKVDMEAVGRRLKFLTGVSYEDFMLLDKMENFKPEDCLLAEPYNVSYCLLFQDILLGLFDADAKAQGFADGKHYAELANKLSAVFADSYMRTALFDYPEAVCRALAIKADLGLRLKEAYDKGDKKVLAEIMDMELPELSERMKKVREAAFAMWFQLYSPFGFEEQDEHYGRVLCRIETTRARLRQYLSGKISSIAELERIRLPYFTEHSKNALHWSQEGILHPRNRPVV